jgi:leucyl/phenylalanyl-tRNA---protein transferase
LLDKAIKGEADFGKLPVDRPVSGAQALGIIAERG